MSDKLVNNWKAANELEKFKQTYMKPLNDQVNKADAILHDPNQPWKGDNERASAKKKFAGLETKNADFANLYNAVSDLVREHEDLTSAISEIYMKWYVNVAYKGKQPTEMMVAQAEILQDIFIRLYDIMEPMKLGIPKPADEKSH